jgi:hypothetical protein
VTPLAMALTVLRNSKTKGRHARHCTRTARRNRSFASCPIRQTVDARTLSTRASFHGTTGIVGPGEPADLHQRRLRQNEQAGNQSCGANLGACKQQRRQQQLAARNQKHC